MIKRYFKQDELDCDHDEGLNQKGGIKTRAWVVENSVPNNS